MLLLTGVKAFWWWWGWPPLFPFGPAMGQHHSVGAGAVVGFGQVEARNPDPAGPLPRRGTETSALPVLA